MVMPAGGVDGGFKNSLWYASEPQLSHLEDLVVKNLEKKKQIAVFYNALF